MKATHKTLIKRAFLLVLTAVMTVQTAITVLPQTARAAEESIPAVTAEVSSPYGNKLQLTDYLPKVIEYTDPISGFTHPGVGVTKEILENVQKQVRAGVEPWKTYFETMILDPGFGAKDKKPSWGSVNYNAQSLNGSFIKDANNAYAQAVMYVVTGDNVYRKNALAIIRAFEISDPEGMAYFTDACIHTGIPTNKLCIAAEIIRYTDYQLTDGYTDADLKWTDEDTEKFISNFLSPEVAVFQSSSDRFMNQHLYTNIGTMSAYLFMDDAEGYNKAVEWFTVNRNARDQGQNGSIKRLFREITTLDGRGMTEGSGPKIDPIVVHVEMGRDQAHGCGDLTNSAILSRLMQSQNTKVDPVTGTVSTDADAVDCYTFLGDRMVKAANFFFEYMLGYDAKWSLVPFAIDEDGLIKDSYASFSSEYRGRYGTINFWDFYVYYRYNRKMTPEQIKSAWPFFYNGYTQKTYTTWDNKDGGGDFWLFLPAEAAGDTSLIPNSSPAGTLEIEHRGNVATDKNYGSLVTDGDGTTYIHITPSSEGTRIAMNSAGLAVEKPDFQFRIRTKGTAALSMSGSTKGPVYLPDTNGQWINFSYKRTGGEALGDMYFFTVSDLTDQNGYVDVDLIYTDPQVPVSFDRGQETYTLTTCQNVPFSMAFTATGTGVAYSLTGDPPAGMQVDSLGNVTCANPAAGKYVFYVQAKADSTIATKRIEMTVSPTRAEAIRSTTAPVDQNAVYISRTKKVYDAALREAEAAANDSNVTDAQFAELLNKLNEAVSGLELVSPMLKNDPLTDGTSLDFRGMNLGNRSTFEDPAVWLDNEPGSFVGFWLVEDKACIMDFGPDFKISVNKFGYMARAGFSDRLAGMQVYGSNDRENWTKLTVKEAAYQQAYQTVEVDLRYHSEQYRYLRLKKTTEYQDVLHDSYGNLLEFGELRIWGTRHETGNLIKSITMSSDQLSNGRIKMGDTVKVAVTGYEPLQELQVLINGITANITTGADNVYTATAVMQASDTCKTGAVNVQVNCKNAAGEAGEPFYGTTDGSTLFLVNSDAFVDIDTLAKSISGTDPYDPKRTNESNAKMLFDGDLASFGDLKLQLDGYYTVDFGEGVGVSLKEVMLYPRSTGQNHAKRLDNTVIYGSNDPADDYADKAWTQLTPPVTGATNEVWTHIPESAMMDTGSYRFFKIAGAENGDIAEVEFYGVYGADVGSVAQQIKSLPVHEATDTQLRCDGIPAGFTVKVKQSSDPSVISMEGVVCAKETGSTVTVTLTIRGPDGRTADTSPITVTVKGIDTLLTGISTPAKGAAQLTLPSVPGGYTVSVTNSSNTSVVEQNGTVKQPSVDTLVNVTLTLTRASDSLSIEKTYPVLIYGQTEAEKVDTSTAKDIVASCKEWSNPPGRGLDEHAIAARVFDGDTSTYGDLQDATGYYTVDFGENVTVQPSKFRLYPRTSNFDRMNNAVISGSNDGQTWTAITSPVSGAQKDVWYEIGAEDFVNYGSFRYFQISGAQNGNIAEVEFYGIKEGKTTGPVTPPEPEEPPVGAVDVAALVDSTSATWSEHSNLLFDNSLQTFGDFEAATYTIDFGEGKTFDATDFWVYPRIIKKDVETNEYVNRLNGVTIQGSSDNINWVDLTAALSGASTIKWYKLTMSQDTGSYRYIKITGATWGNIAEVRFYGTVGQGTVTPGPDVPEEPEAPVKENRINVLSVATAAASCGGWKGNPDAATCAANVLDGDETTTFGDLNDANGYYTIDFGEGKALAATDIWAYPRDGQQSGKGKGEYADRLNGLKIQGSNNGSDWTDLTVALTGIPVKDDHALKWYHLELTDAAKTAYRYIKITGSDTWGGNAGAVWFYGTISEGGAAGLAAGEWDGFLPSDSWASAGEDLRDDRSFPPQPENPDGEQENIG